MDRKTIYHRSVGTNGEVMFVGHPRFPLAISQPGYVLGLAQGKPPIMTEKGARAAKHLCYVRNIPYDNEHVGCAHQQALTDCLQSWQAYYGETSTRR